MAANDNKTLGMPSQGQTVAYRVSEGERIAFGFAPEEVDMDLARNGNNLEIHFDNDSTLVLSDFFEFLDSEDAPVITLADAEISSLDFLNVFAPDLAPAAGEVLGGGQSEYADDAGQLLAGIGRLSDQGSIRYGTEINADDNLDGLGGIAAAAARPGFPEPGTPGPNPNPDPDPNPNPDPDPDPDPDPTLSVNAYLTNGFVHEAALNGGTGEDWNGTSGPVDLTAGGGFNISGEYENVTITIGGEKVVLTAAELQALGEGQSIVKDMGADQLTVTGNGAIGEFEFTFTLGAARDHSELGQFDGGGEILDLPVDISVSGPQGTVSSADGGLDLNIGVVDDGIIIDGDPISQISVDEPGLVEPGAINGSLFEGVNFIGADQNIGLASFVINGNEYIFDADNTSHTVTLDSGVVITVDNQGNYTIDGETDVDDDVQFDLTLNIVDGDGDVYEHTVVMEVKDLAPEVFDVSSEGGVLVVEQPGSEVIGDFNSGNINGWLLTDGNNGGIGKPPQKDGEIGSSALHIVGKGNSQIDPDILDVPAVLEELGISGGDNYQNANAAYKTFDGASGDTISFKYQTNSHASDTEETIWVLKDASGNMVASGQLTGTAGSAEWFFGQMSVTIPAGYDPQEFTLVFASVTTTGTPGTGAELWINDIEVQGGEIEYLKFSGNVHTDESLAGNVDVLNDDAVITSVHYNGVDYPMPESSEGPLVIDTENGTLTMYQNGDYSFVSNSGLTDSLAEDFSYTVTDKDGDTATADLYIRSEDLVINGDQNLNLDDELHGNQYDNIIFGGDGDDVIHATGGDNIIFGGSGDDTMYSGDGSDTFVWTQGDLGGIDTILNFTLGEDKLLFEGLFNGQGDDRLSQLSDLVDEGTLTLTVGDSDKLILTMQNQTVEIGLNDSLSDADISSLNNDIGAKVDMLQLLLSSGSI